MSRNITFIAVFAVALTFAADSQAFAKGGKVAGKGGVRPAVNHNRGGNRVGRFDRHFGHRSGWGYGYASYPVVVAEAPVVETPVVDADEVVDVDATPVVEATPVVDATPVVATYDNYYFGGHRGRDFRHNHGRIGGHHSQGGHVGHVGHGKK